MGEKADERIHVASVHRREQQPPLPARQLRLADIIAVEVNKVELYTVFDFNWSKLMQVLAPTGVLPQIVGDAFGKKNVTSITAGHHSLSNVDPTSGDILPFVYIRDRVDGSGVNSHP